MNNLKEKLMEFGMFEKEARAYLRLLPKGEAQVEDLIDEETEYGDVLVALDSLADKQLVDKISAMDKNYFKVKDPELVLKNLNIKIAQAKASEEKIDQVMLNLDWFYQQTEKSMNLLRGYEGVLELRKKMFAESYDNFYNITSLHKSLPENHIQSLLNHARKSIQVIIPKSDEKNLNSIKQTLKKEPKLKIKLIDDDFWKKKQEIVIFNQIVAVGDIADEQFFSVIEDENMAVAMKNIFQTLWKLAEDF